MTHIMNSLSLSVSLSPSLCCAMFLDESNLHSASPILMTVLRHMLVVRSNDAFTVLDTGFEANVAVHVAASPILMTVVRHLVVVRSDDAVTVLGSGYQANVAVHV